MGALAWVGHALAVALALPLALVAVPLAALAMTVSVAQQLTGPAIYKDALASQRLYGRLPALAAAQLSTQIGYIAKDAEPSATDSGAPSAFRGMSADKWERILTEVLPAGWLRTQTESALDQLLADPPPAGPVLVSIVALKAHLMDAAGVRAYLELMSEQPPCSVTEVEAWRSSSLALPTCRPPDEIVAAATPALQADLTKVLNGLPDEVDLRGALGVSPPEGDSSGGLDIAKLRTLIRIAILAPLVPAAMILLLVVRSRRSLLRWLGVPLLAAATLALAIAVAGVPWIDAQLTRELARAPAYWSPVLLDAVHGLALEALRTIGLRLSVVAGLAMVVSGVMVIAGYRRAGLSLPAIATPELAAAPR